MKIFLSHLLNNTKNGFLGMQDEENEQKHEGKKTPKISLREKMKNIGVWENGHAFLVFSCPKSQK